MRVCAALVLLSMVACSSSAIEERLPDPENVLFERMVEERYAKPFRSGDLDAWMGVFAADAVALHNRRPADEGREAIRAFGELVFTTFRAETFDIVVREVRRSGAWVVTRGDFYSHLVMRASGESAPWGAEAGKFLFVWEQDSDGEWRIIVDMGNAGSDHFPERNP